MDEAGLPALIRYENDCPVVLTIPFGPLPREVVVTKQYASTFFGTPFAATLAAMRVDTLVIAVFRRLAAFARSRSMPCSTGSHPVSCAMPVVTAHSRRTQAKYTEVVGEACMIERLFTLS